MYIKIRYTHTHTPLFISRWTFGLFYNLIIADNAAINIRVHVPLQICILVSFG